MRKCCETLVDFEPCVAYKKACTTCTQRTSLVTHRNSKLSQGYPRLAIVVGLNFPRENNNLSKGCKHLGDRLVAVKNMVVVKGILSGEGTVYR